MVSPKLRIANKVARMEVGNAAQLPFKMRYPKKAMKRVGDSIVASLREAGNECPWTCLVRAVSHEPSAIGTHKVVLTEQSRRPFGPSICEIGTGLGRV